MTKHDAVSRPTASVLLNKFKSWKTRNGHLIKTTEENIRLKEEVQFWKNKYLNLKTRLTERELTDFLSDSEVEEVYS